MGMEGDYRWDERNNPEMEDEEYCDEDCSKCKMKVNYTMFDQEDDGDID